MRTTPRDNRRRQRRRLLRRRPSSARPWRQSMRRVRCGRSFFFSRRCCSATSSNRSRARSTTCTWGRCFGVGALAAVSSFFPVMFFFIAFIIGLGAGASVLIGQAWGARDADKAQGRGRHHAHRRRADGPGDRGVRRRVHLRRCWPLLGTPPDVLADSTRYARIMLIAMPGRVRVPAGHRNAARRRRHRHAALTLVISTLIGLVVTPALIRGWGGLPQLGVASGACGVGRCPSSWRPPGSASGCGARKSPLAPDAAFMRNLRIQPQLLKAVLASACPRACR